jgi:CRISPR/Cas system-associated exonuclease Cas4 (RecB family)
VSLGTSEAYDHLSPTSYERMRRCREQAAFASESRGRGAASAAQRLGRICHRVLENPAVLQALATRDAPVDLDSAWEAEVQVEAEQLASTRGTARLGSPDQWPDYQLRRAQLRHAAGALREVALSVGTATQIQAEAPLASADGRLGGWADFVLRGRDGEVVIDLKTGGARDQLVAESHDRQIQLYAFMLHEEEGVWPRRGLVMSLVDGITEVDVSPRACQEVAANALALLDAYNAVVPGPQPASPSAATCGSCPYATKCGDFWTACGPDWASQMLALQGRVIRHAGDGPISVWVRPTAGSVSDSREIAIRAIDTLAHPGATALSVGSEVWAVGLLPTADEAVYRLPAYGLLRVA